MTTDDGRGPGGDGRPRGPNAGLVACLVGGAAGIAIGGVLYYHRSQERDARERALEAEAVVLRAEARRQAGQRAFREAAAGMALAGPRSAWAEAPKGAAELGRVKVRVADAAIGRVAEGGKEEAGATLILQVEVTPPAGGRVEYKGWGAADAVALRDQRGTPYRFRPRAEKSRVPADPGKPLLDVLVFDRPADGGGTLELELPGSAVGVAGTFRVRIPRDVWDRPAPVKD